jgi:hypothetical protein
MAIGNQTFDVAAGGSTTIYYRGYPDYDAIRVDFDSSNSGSTGTDITFNTYSDNDPRDADERGDFGNMDTVSSSTGQDVTSGDPSYGTGAVSRVVAVEINETGGTSGCAGSVSLHKETDSEQTKEAFLNR